MKLKDSLIFCIVIIGTPNLLYAQENASCTTFETPNSVLKCVRLTHPTIPIQNATVQTMEFAAEQAGQIPNPNLDIEAVNKKGEGFVSELSLLHTFQLGGKASAREQLALTSHGISKLQSRKNLENLTMQTVEDLYRLRQVRQEREVAQENIKTFERLIKKYRRIGKLSPEQKVSVSVFSLAEKENRLKDNALQNEEQEIETRFQIALRSPVKLSQNSLPAFTTEWPSLNGNEVSGTDLKIANKHLESAEAGLNLEKSESWPDLSIGPRFEIETAVQGQTEFRAGIALSLPLPIYQANGAGRAKARSNLERETMTLAYTKDLLTQEKKILRASYDRAVALMKKMADTKSIEAQHRDLHNLLNRGVVSAPLVIESHRQLLEYYENLHEEEIKGVRALWRTYALENRILKEEIK